ncbi:MAG TPA: hypothetical protein VFH70_11905, partial [Acidimicrobiales bacterium]|nr:hypothetical protein [Acidimicrobiales bacterium]
LDPAPDARHGPPEDREVTGAVELPARSDLTGNTLVTMSSAGKGGQRSHWVAVWRTPRGNFIHQQTPFTTDEPRADAVDYALSCPQSWSVAG